MKRGAWWLGPVLLASLAGVVVGVAPARAQGPAMPDPRQMSGIPRVDPQTEPGTLVARVLRGSFQNPGVGLTVTLELTAADGKLETKTAVSDAQGRATFDMLGHAGSTAVVRVEFEGERVASQTVNVDPNVGVRVLLVQGAAEAASSRPAGPTTPSAAEGPRPGAAFPNQGQAKGTIMVGALDLAGNRPFVGVEVRLEVKSPGKELEVRRIVTDGRGAASFAGLGTLPVDTTFTAETELNGEVRRSETFTIDGQEHGIAVVLTARGGGSAPAPQLGPQRRPLQPPRAVPTLPAGTVRATIVGPDDRPVDGLEVTVVRLDVTGTQERFVGESGPDGQARLADIRVAEDSLYRVEVTFKGAPFRSRLFQMTDRMGVLLDVRVFPTTSDPTRVRTGIQFGIEAVENDLARVVQVYQLVVEGDEAFWPKTPLKISGAVDSTGMVLLEDRVNVDLELTEGAPFATLREPLPPGEVTDMSIAYLMDHDGALTLRWTSPFPVATGRALTLPPVKLRKGSVSGPTRPPHQEGQDQVEIDMWDLGELAVGASYEFEVEGLVSTSRLPRGLGVGFGVGIALATLLGLLLAPRTSLEQRLRKRQAVLLRALDRADAAVAAGTPGAGDERARIIGLLDQVFRQIDVVVATVPHKHVDPGVTWIAK